MSMLDQLLIEGVRRTTPENKPWNAGQFLTNVGQFVNTNERINELQRQNSLRNLIKQREEDGVPFDRLSNEAAKYDLNKALTMRGEARDSIKFNRTESEAELANHKKTMAGWLGGIVLRRAQDAVNSGDAKWDFDYVVNVCNKAAAAIFPYDPSTATALMNFGKQGLTKKASPTKNTRASFTKDHELDGKFNTTINTLQGLAPDPEKDRSGYANKVIRLAAAQRLQRWKNVNPYLEDNLEGRQLWSHMIDELATYASNKFDDSLSGNSKVQDTTKWLRTEITDDEISNLFPKYAEPESADVPEAADDKAANELKLKETTPKGNVVKGKAGNIAKPESNEAKKPSYVIPKDIVGYNIAGAPIYSRRKGSQFGRAIANADTRDDIQSLRDVLDNSAHIKNDNNDIFSSFEKRIKDREDEIKEVDKFARENGIGEADLRKFKDLFGTRATTTIIRQWKNFHAFNGGYLSKNPGTAINNALLTMNPDYKPTDYDAKVTKVVSDPENSFTEWQGIVASMNIPFLSKVMDYKMFSEALQATAGDVATTMRGAWEATIDGMSPEEVKKTKSLYTKMFKLDANDWKILNGENYPVGKDYEEQRKAYANRNSGNTADLVGTKKKTVDVNEDTSKSGTATYTKESWDNF